MTLEKVVETGTFQEEDVSAVVGDIESNVRSLVDIVDKLGPLLTHKETSKRQTGLEFLSKVLAGPQSSLRQDEAGFLIQFYVDRLKDTPLMHPLIVMAFHVLLLRHGHVVNDESVFLVLRSIFDQINTQALTLNDRTRVLDIISWCLNNRLTEVTQSKFSTQFVLGFLHAVEGETGPKNLIMIFSLWPVVIKSFDCSTFWEEIFEVLSCYFPVDFSPQKNSSGKIRKPDLASGLQNCLSCTPHFAPWAIPLFLEKFSSDLEEAKLDSLRCFQACLPQYSPVCLNEHLKNVWVQCKQEIMGIRSFQASEKVTQQTHEFLRVLTKTLCQCIQTAENSSVLLNWIEITWSEIKPFLTFLEGNLMENAVAILCTLCSADELMNEPILKESISVLLGAYSAADDKLRIYEMICKLLESGYPFKAIPDWASKFAKTCELDNVNSDNALRAASHKSLALACQKMPYSTLDALLIECFNRFNLDPNFVAFDTKQEVVIGLFNRKENFLMAWCGSQFPITSKNVNNLSLISLMCFKRPKIFKNIFPSILSGLGTDKSKQNLVISETFSALENIFDQVSAELLEPHYKSILINLSSIRSSDESIKSQQCKLIAQLFRQIRDPDLVTEMDSISEMDPLMSSFCSLHSTLIASSNIFDRLLAKKFEVVSREESIVIGSFCNKLYPHDKIKTFLGSLIDSDVQTSLNFHWILKSLLMRGAKESKYFLEKYLEKKSLLSPSEFENLFISDCEYYNLKSGHKILPFYKQKIFLLTFPKLLEWYQSDPNDLYLNLITTQLPFLSNSILSSELMPHVPKLMSTLFNPEATKLSSASKSFINFILGQDVSLLHGIADSVVPVLLGLALNVEVDLKDRISALELVGNMASETCQRDVMSLVIQKTAKLLNDNKRLIRKAAAEARNLWILCS